MRHRRRRRVPVARQRQRWVVVRMVVRGPVGGAVRGPMRRAVRRAVVVVVWPAVGVWVPSHVQVRLWQLQLGAASAGAGVAAARAPKAGLLRRSGSATTSSATASSCCCSRGSGRLGCRGFLLCRHLALLVNLSFL
ncbi:hypothetical protein MNEG_13770 [Monoraphidium neglectum]|uniref:Uncharacterized protein n=1 Tax=Monoraphidium neglectum TaxID=145388 RepID=A0A0D2KEH6_9CHLO|nr:hypothetical protein MNEG_13770 [Monoraphidium neglectum]KIY94193.1 hypothetical protein MNEG_13770 [Monoraphidium neglectum]|eukprot:XP_013893213.1 hypothetical protein MNEG_13770 [Monoraphidium neglectum]